MDNVTHSLAGMLLAEAVLVSRREARPQLRAVAYLASALANNLPDTDIVYTWITGPKPLGSLLHHRGHTHTLAFALPMAWLLGLGLWRWYSRRNADASKRDQNLILGLCLVGPLLHLTMDLGNNYGIHPFWPISGRWFYGDTIFIVEPLWWAISIPILMATLRRRWLRWLLGVLLVGILLVYWYVPFSVAGSCAVLFGLTLIAAAVARLATERSRIVFAVAAWLSVALVFVVASNLAKAQVRRAVTSAFPALDVHDIAATPLPANPVCWEALVAGEQGGRYRVIRSSVALAPFAVAGCHAGADVSPTALVKQLDRPDREGVRFRTEFDVALAELRALSREDCRFRALLQFARLPYFSTVERTHSHRKTGLYAGDLRYDREPGLDFSDLQLPEDPLPVRAHAFYPAGPRPAPICFSRSGRCATGTR